MISAFSKALMIRGLKEIFEQLKYRVYLVA